MELVKIKSLKVYKIPGTDSEKYIHQEREYDAKGNKLKDISYSEEEEPIDEKFFTYDESGKLLEEKSHYAEDEVTEVIRFEYDAENRIVKTHKSYGEQGDEDCTLYTYNLTGKLVEKRTESSDGEIEQKESWKYEDEKLMEHTVKDYAGTMLESSKFIYTEKGEIAEELRYTSETEQTLKICFDYPLAGKIPDTTVYNNKGNIVQRSRHTYDNNQRLAKEVIEAVSNGVQKFTTEYVYDESNNIIETRVVDKNENLISKIVYKHNMHNLPIEEIHFEHLISGVDLKQTTTVTEYEFY